MTADDLIDVLVKVFGLCRGLYCAPPELFFYVLPVPILAVALFERRKVFYILYMMLSYLMMGVNGIAVGLLWWVMFMLVQTGFDFFGGRGVDNGL